MKTVLVTGARGFVGASMIEYILNTTDWRVYYTKRPQKDNDRLDTMDLKERVYVWNSDVHINVILHIAGNPSSLSCIENPIGAVNDNIMETIKTLEIARQHDVSHFIYFSSVEVYGKNGMCLEDDMCSSVNMYGATKYSGEQICQAYHSSYGVPCSIVRLNNTFGKFCQEERFPMIALKKLMNKEKFTLHTHNGEILGKRWTSIYDVADMVLFILDQPPGKIYNTTHDYITNLQFLKYLASAMNIPNFDYELVEENVSGRTGIQDAPPNLIKSLGWKPSKSFTERIQEFVNHFVKPTRVCVLGSTGFIGKNILSKYPDWIGVSREDLDLTKQSEVESFFNRNSFDVVVHCAASIDQKSSGTTFDNITMFENVARSFKGKLLYFSSGASLRGNPPIDPYGLSKWIIDKRIHTIDDAHILRIWGCYGPGELSSRFSSICKNDKHVIIKKDKLFSYVHIDEVCRVVNDYVTGLCTKKEINISGQSKLLSEWAYFFGATCEIEDTSELDEPYTPKT